MLHPRYGRWLATLAAGAALGVLLPAPLQAQQRPPLGAGTISREALSTLQLVQAGKGSGVFCCKLGDYITYAIADHSTLPACVILIPPTPAEQPDALDALARRFVKAYKLTDYRIVVAKDNSAAFLFREDSYSRHREYKGLSALAAEKSPAAAIRWLNATCGEAPHRLEGTKLVWRCALSGGGNRRGMEITLNLLQSLPGYADIRLRNVNNSAACDLVSEQLRLGLKPLSGSKGSAMRKKLGAKPLGYVKEKHLAGSLALVRAGNESGHYRLGAPEALAAARGQEEEIPLPELPQVAWVDDARPAAPEPVAAPQAPQATLAPAEHNPAPTRPDRAADNSAPALPAPLPTPAEARQTYAERLRAL